MRTRPLYPELDTMVSALDPAHPGADRRRTLDDLALWISARHARGEPAKLVFICTHNSRRSHMGQLWTQALAAAHGLAHVETYSGGTEATAFNSRAVAALRACGFRIKTEHDGKNPLYRVSFAEDADAVRAWSKTFDDGANPREDFAAVMTCSDADEACPIVPGAAARFSLPYRDPKEADGTADESAVYAARSREIAAEMLYVIRRAAEMSGWRNESNE